MRTPFAIPVFLFATGFFLLTSWALRANENSFTIDLPFQTSEATPIWLGHPQTPASTFAQLNLPIIPPDATSSLFVTVYFKEKEGGFLRVGWQGTENVILSDNFYEGIAMDNQRSLLLSPKTLQAGGVLTFQGDDATLNVERIKLEWLENHSDLDSPQIQEVLVTAANGTTQLAQNLDGQPKPLDSAAWHNRVVTVPLTQLPERVEQGVEYSVQLDDVPNTARLALEESGLPWGQHLVVWINQQRSGTITPEVPDLTDDDALPGEDSGYIGWRKGAIYIPANFLKSGGNTVQFEVESDTVLPTADNAAPPEAGPLALKNVAFQFKYVAPASIASPPARGDTSSSQPAIQTPSPTPDSSSTTFQP